MQNKVANCKRIGNFERSYPIVNCLVKETSDLNRDVLIRARQELSGKEFKRLQWMHDAMTLVAAWAAHCAMDSADLSSVTTNQYTDHLRKAFLKIDRYCSKISVNRALGFMHDARSVTLWTTFPQNDATDKSFADWCRFIYAHSLRVRTKDQGGLISMRCDSIRVVASMVARTLEQSEVKCDDYSDYSVYEVNTYADYEQYLTMPVSTEALCGYPSLDITWDMFIPPVAYQNAELDTAYGLVLLIAAYSECYDVLVDSDPMMTKAIPYFEELVWPYPMDVDDGMHDHKDSRLVYPTISDLTDMYDMIWED